MTPLVAPPSELDVRRRRIGEEHASGVVDLHVALGSERPLPEVMGRRELLEARPAVARRDRAEGQWGLLAAEPLSGQRD